MESDTFTGVTKALIDEVSSREGYLPVPLRIVPPEMLAELEVHLIRDDQAALYRGQDTRFTAQDRDRLLANGVDFVYISTRDHDRYYRTIGDHLVDIVADPHIQEQKKAEILHATSIELSNQLLETPPDQQDVARLESVAGATVQYVINNEDAFAHLFEVSNHDFYTATHMVNVCTYAVVLGTRMGLDDSTLESLAAGCLLHDVGKIFVPSKLLNETRPLTDEQFQTMQSHVEKGYDHLKEVTDLPETTLSAVSQHHERMDGSGYPHALSKREISQFGRIVAVADTFEAMTAVRPYRRGTFSIQDTLAHVEDQAGAKYDAAVVVEFAEMIRERLKSTDEEAGPDELNGMMRPCRRRHERHFFRLSAIVSRIDDSTARLSADLSWGVLVHNLSRSGLGFISTQALEPNRNVIVSLRPQPADEEVLLPAVVIQCKDHYNGWHTVGARFHELQDLSLIEQLRKILLVR